MFTNMGGKIKTLGKIVCWIGIIVSIIMAITTWVNGAQMASRYSYYSSSSSSAYIWTGLGILIGGCLGSWIGSFFMCGFGELIEETALNRAATERLISEVKHLNRQ